MILQNNQINIIGKVISNFSFSHEIDGEKFYLIEWITFFIGFNGEMS